MIEIRAAAPADAEGISRVHVRSWQVAYRGLLPGELLAGLSVEKRTEARQDALTKPQAGVLTWIALSEAEILGFAAHGPPRDEDLDPTCTAELYAIYIDPDHWGQGIGGRLLAQVLSETEGTPAQRITLWVLEGNQSARAFYEHADFKPEGATKIHDFGSVQLPKLRYVRAC